MSKRQPDFDLDLVDGKQAELWVADIQRTFEGAGQIEVKAPKPWLKAQSFYVEYACKFRAGWGASGIATTKAKAWFFKFGSLPGGLIVETEWLKRAARLAHKRGLLKDTKRGSHPTRAVVVSMRELWETRDGEP